MMNVDDMLSVGNGEAERFCGCDELMLGQGKDRHRAPCPRYHNCGYVLARDRLIPAASKIATERMRLTADDDTQSRSMKWTRQFSIAMDELSAPLLRNGA